MSQPRAQRLARDRLDALKGHSYAELRERFIRNAGTESPDRVEADATAYHVEVEASYEADTPNIRVVVTVDDLGLEDFTPVWEDFVIAPDSTIIAG